MDHRELVERLEREERKLGNPIPLRVGRRQRAILQGVTQAEFRLVMTEYALKKYPERASIAA
jgi:hypothetical protein